MDFHLTSHDFQHCIFTQRGELNEKLLIKEFKYKQRENPVDGKHGRERKNAFYSLSLYIIYSLAGHSLSIPMYIVYTIDYIVIKRTYGR